MDEARKRVQITQGMANAMNGASAARVCGSCSLSIPKYPGRYPAECPSCGGKLGRPRGGKKVYAEGREGTEYDIGVSAYGFALDIDSFTPRNAKQWDVEKGTRGNYSGTVSYYGDESPEELLDDDDNEELLDAASKVSRLKLHWTERTWIPTSRRDGWSRHVRSDDTVYEAAVALPVVAVSRVPRIQAVIEAGTYAGEACDGDSSCSRSKNVPYSVVEKLVPGGLHGLAMFLEGPRDGVSFRVESVEGPVLIFEFDDAHESLRVFATERPEAYLGADPREEIAEACDGGMSGGPGRYAGSASGGFTRKDVLSPRTAKGGATRAVGRYRFELGRNRKSDQHVDLTRSLQNTRNSKRGLAGRIKAAKAWHKGAAGSSYHKDLGRFNSGNHKGKPIGPGQREAMSALDMAALYESDDPEWALYEGGTATAEIHVPLAGNLGVPRKQMPQVLWADIPHFMEWLKERGVHFTKTQIRAGSLKATQKEMNVAKIARLVANAEHDPATIAKLKQPIFTSSDHYVLDGHHRWAAVWNLPKHESVDDQMPVIQIQMPIHALLKLMDEYPRTYHKDVDEAQEDTVSESKLDEFGPSGVGILPTQSGSYPEQKTLDDTLDAVLRKLITIESQDLLQDIEITDEGAIFLYFDPSTSEPEIAEVLNIMRSAEPSIQLVGTPDARLPGEQFPAQWWVFLLPTKQEQLIPGPPPAEADAETKPPEDKPGDDEAPKQQMVTQGKTTIDQIAADLDVDAAVQSIGEQLQSTSLGHWDVFDPSRGQGVTNVIGKLTREKPGAQVHAFRVGTGSMPGKSLGMFPDLMSAMKAVEGASQHESLRVDEARDGRHAVFAGKKRIGFVRQVGEVWVAARDGETFESAPTALAWKWESAEKAAQSIVNLIEGKLPEHGKVLAESIADEILRQLRVDRWMFGSWGARDIFSIENGSGVQFDVRGLKFKGRVIVKYDHGHDLYNITFGRVRSHEWRVVSSINGIDAENLARTIDAFVERH